MPGLATWDVLAAVLISAAVITALGPVNQRRLARAREITRARTDREADAPDPDAAVLHSLVRRAIGYWGRRRERGILRASALEVLSAFAGELRAGQPIRAALERASEASSRAVCPRAVGVARLGGDVPRALQRDAAEQELPMLRSLAALWQVAEDSGAGLAEAVDRLAAAEMSSEGVRRELVSQLAAPKATARVLAGLPLVGMLLGSGLGASPVVWLFGSPWGLAVLTAGCTLEILGLWWTGKLTRAVEASL